MKRRIVPGGILGLSLAVVLLAATASTASAEPILQPWYCPSLSTSPTTIDQVPQECLSDPFGFEGFGDRQVGTTSLAQGFALAVFGNETFTPRISVSGDYAQTNNCPPTLSAGALPQLQGCLINVTFAPTGTGPKDGTLSTGPGGATVALTGTGVTTPTPWDWPLKLAAGAARGVPHLPARDETLEKKEKRVALLASTNADSTVVVSGGVKKTTKRLAGEERRLCPPRCNGDSSMTKIHAKLKHPTRLQEKPFPEVKIKFAATDEFGQTATEKIKVGFCVGTKRDCR